MGRKSNYENGLFNQLQEIMNRLDSVESELCTEKKEHKEDVDRLNAKIDSLTQENTLLRNDNARLESIINNERKRSATGGQKGHKGTTLTKNEIEKKIREGKCRHEIRTVGNPICGKYVVDLKTEAVITEIRIFADEHGKFSIPPEYRSDVTYGENVKALAVSLYSEGVMANDRIAAFLNAAGGDVLELSEGSIYGFCKKFARNAAESIQDLESNLLNQPVVATDATTVTVTDGHLCPKSSGVFCPELADISDRQSHFPIPWRSVFIIF